MGCPFEKQKGVTITSAFRKFLDEFYRKSNKIWVDKGRKFYHRSMKSWLQDNDMEMYSMQSEGKSQKVKKDLLLEPQRIKFTNIWR